MATGGDRGENFRALGDVAERISHKAARATELEKSLLAINEHLDYLLHQRAQLQAEFEHTRQGLVQDLRRLYDESSNNIERRAEMQQSLIQAWAAEQIDVDLERLALADLRRLHSELRKSAPRIERKAGS